MDDLLVNNKTMDFCDKEKGCKRTEPKDLGAWSGIE
jgi:hypothetical protein